MSGRKSQIPAIYGTAIRRFEEITGKKLDDPDLLRIATVDGLMKEVDKRNDKFSKFRDKRHTFFNVLEGAMKPIELVGNLAAGAASMAFPPSSLVFGAATYLIGAAKGTSASYDAIQDLMGTLKVKRSF
jgi:fungal STAND N-terminal Goodbye domain